MTSFYKSVNILSGLVMISVLGACSNIKPYPDHRPENVIVKVTADSGSFFTDIKTALHIYSVNNDCKSNYLGTVDFENPITRLGLPTNELLYLDFSFVNSGFLSSQSSSMSYDTLLTPLKAAQYNIELNYMDDMYNMEIWEKLSNKVSKRELDRRSYDSCKQSK